MTGQSQAQGPPPQAIETSVQVALRIRPIFIDTRNQSRVRQRAETEVLSVIERSPTPSSLSGASGTASGHQHDQPQQIAVVPLQRHFTFDHVFGTASTQEEVYQGSVKRMVDKFLEGYNVTIMAYGQTSSGKTYTMGTGAPSSEDRGSPYEGIIPRAVTQLFQEAKRPPPVYPGYRIPPLKTTFRVSFVEIYNEDLIDLLAKGDFRPQVTIREDAKGHIFWTGVQEIVVTSVEEVIHLLWFGSQNRQTHSTEMNEKSSRSHAIFSITLRQEKFVPTHPLPPQPSVSTDTPLLSKRAKTPTAGFYSTNGAAPGSAASSRPGTPTASGSGIPTPFTSGIVAPGSKFRRQSAMIDTSTSFHSSSSLSAAAHLDDPEPEGEWVVLNSKFHLVDLAGSERLKRTSAIGDRAKEGISINAGLHVLGNVISALGDPSKKASHVPYRDSKLTRLLQDSLGGNALALMIACVSPSELNLGETLNTLKYANRARNIKNSSSLNQELNMDNPEYLRSIIQKLKLEIKMLKDTTALKAATGSGAGDTTPVLGSENAAQRSLQYNRQSMSTLVPGALDDGTNEDRAMSPSPSQRLSHYHSRDTISTDASHGHLDSVQEEEDRYSDASSSSARTAVVDTGANGTRGSSASSPKSRPNILPLTIPPSLDTQSFQEFVEPVIEEYEKVVSDLETRLAKTQASLNHSELALEVQQGRIDAIEDENRVLHQSQLLRRSSGGESDGPVSWRKQQRELELLLQKMQEELEDAEARKLQSDQKILELEHKLELEQAAAQEQIQQASKEKEEQSLHSDSSSVQLDTAKEQELKLLSNRIRELEEQCHRQQEEAEAEAESLRLAQTAREESPATVLESDQDREEQEAKEAKREEELIEMLQAKAALEIELESEKTRHEALLLELEVAKASHIRTDSAHANDDHDDDLIVQLDVIPALQAEDPTKQSLVQELEAHLAEARESERLLKDETSVLLEKVEKLQKDHEAALEMEEMLHLAVADLEGRLQTSQDTDSKHLEELERNLARIQDLEERSTKAEQEALKVVEDFKAKLADAKSAAEETLADELLDLLENMDKEREKVEALQTQVENQLAELAAEKSRASKLESDRDAIEAQWNADKERIQTLEKEIEEQSVLVFEKVGLIALLEERLSQHEETQAAKLQLEQELQQRVSEHDDALASKSVLVQELEQELRQRASEHEDALASKSALVQELEQELRQRVSEHDDVLASKSALVQELEQELHQRVSEHDDVLVSKSVLVQELEQKLQQRVSEHEDALASKSALVQELEQELRQRVSEHDDALASKSALVQELEQELQQRVGEHEDALASKSALVQELEQELRQRVSEHDDALASKSALVQELEQELQQRVGEHEDALASKSALVQELEQELRQRVSEHDDALASKSALVQELEQELQQRVGEHEDALASKSALVQELEQKISELETTLQSSDESTTESMAKVQGELSEAMEQLKESQAKGQEQQQILQELTEKVAALDAEAVAARNALSGKDADYEEAIQALEAEVKIAEADRDDAETRLEETQRRHQAVDEEIQILQITVAEHLATIDLLHNELSEAKSSAPSRPVSTSSSAVAAGLGDDPSPAIQKLEKEKARYRALVRENEKEIERLSQDLESLASEFSNAATAFEDAEEDMKARITELESLLEDKTSDNPNSQPSTLRASSLTTNQSAPQRDADLNQSSATAQAQLSSLKAERDQALQSSEELSSIVAELNEQNHSLQERLLIVEREQESIKLQHVLEQQAQQDEIRLLRDQTERLDRNPSPGPVGHHQDDARATYVHEGILRHRASSSSDQFANHRGEDSLATPRQSWSTTASVTQGQPGSQIRAGRHESTIIQQAKHIKQLEDRILELQAGGGSLLPGDGSTPKLSPSASAVGLGIHHKSSDPELTRAASSPLIHRQSSDRMSPALRALSTFGPAATSPPTPPPTVPLPPPPPLGVSSSKNTPAHLNSDAPPSPRIGGVMNLESSSPNPSSSIRASRSGSIGRTSSNGISTAAAQGARRNRDSTASNISESVNISGNNGWATPTASTMSASNISAATAQALQGVEVNELRGVVDTLAHQVQALKVEQTMQQGKIHRLEAALAEAEDRLKSARDERNTTAVEKESLAKDLEQVRGQLMEARIKAEKDKTNLEGIVERERKEREKAVETRGIMEARMEELMARKSKFACF